LKHATSPNAGVLLLILKSNHKWSKKETEQISGSLQTASKSVYFFLIKQSLCINTENKACTGKTEKGRGLRWKTEEEARHTCIFVMYR
jgi:hypothetical protein